MKAHVFALAVSLAALAGFVDAISFLKFGGLFVSFMSGNSTEGAVEAAAGQAHALIIARAILVFVVGVTVGELLGGTSGRWGRPLVLLLETAVLGSAAVADHFGQGEGILAPALGLAMGVQNASVHKAGGLSVALTYVTGTLVNIGRVVAAALRGSGSWGSLWPLLALWTGLVCGGFVGALVMRRSDVLAMVVAAAYASALTLWALVAAVIAPRDHGS